MPRAAKRSIEEIAMMSDSNDEDYSDSQPRARKSTTKSRSKTKKRPAKKRRRDSDDDLDDSEISMEEDDLSFEEEEEEEDEDDANRERNARGGVRRRAAARATTYEEPSSDEDELEEEEGQDDDDDELNAGVGKGKTQRKKSLVVKLPVPKSTTAARTARSSRGRSASIKADQTSPTTYHATRRSTRATHNEAEDIVALTNSGRHEEIVRKGTRSPEPVTRNRRGSAAVAQTESVIPEEEESSKSHHAQLEIMESDQKDDLEEDAPAVAASDAVNAENADVDMGEEGFVPESEHGANNEEEDEDDEAPQTGRATRSNRKQHTEENEEEAQPTRRSSRRKQARVSRPPQDEGSDFEPNEDEANEEDVSDSEASSPRKGSQNADDNYESSNDRRSRLRKRQSQSRAESEAGELAEELAELRPSRRRRKEPTGIVYEDKPRRNRKSVDYRIIRPDLILPIEEAENEVNESPSRRPRGGGGSTWQRSLFSTYGPFGGGGGPPPLLGGPSGMGAAGGADSDSSDDEAAQRPKVGGVAGMTPTAATGPGLPLVPGHGEAAPGLSGTPANLGKIKDRQAMADSDPLGIDPNVNFDSVGGLQGHIDQLKEMVSLPLLYPEIFQRFHIVPPRGVLFHGPPGTGKTLLARALASSVSSEGRKVTFYMRKGADALSKWVGEAERQLRLLFEEARKTQPSIIFFDEIDGLAPVRSSKQEQIHASIVSTLLALMDGMDGRGQVIVIGATNRPDSIDPALRRPGRFDREFYFPLPNTEARRAILDIHTKGWDPPLASDVKDELAELTKGYGGADLRALCTEAALNAVQRKYPQIYRSNEKLLIDPKKIEVGPRDFMISIKKMVPSSERSTSSGAAPLPATIEPLLRHPLREIKQVLAEILPQKRKLTALEEAQFEQPDASDGFRKEKMQQEFEASRVFRPRLLIRGGHGMGQQYLAAALMNHFEGLHVQSFDLATLLSDSTRSPEATVVQFFSEVKRHKPSVIYIPNVQTWYETVGQTVISTFLGLLRSLPPTDPVLLLGVLENDGEDVDPAMIKNLFGITKRNAYNLVPPESLWRHEFFRPLIQYVRTSPPDFPDPENRKRRKLETLQPAPATAPQTRAPSKEELKAQKRKDHQTLNILKIRIQPIMDEIKKYKRFRSGVIDESQIRYLYEEEDPNIVTTDVPMEQRSTFRPFEKDVDKHGVPGLRETVSGKFFYNLEIVTIEKRLSNGYYKRFKDFLADIKRLAKDARQLGEQERLLKANELLANVEVDIGLLEQSDPNLVAECENVYQRELEREKAALEKARRAAGEDGAIGPPPSTNVAHADSSNQSSGPVVLGEPFPESRNLPPEPKTPSRTTNQHNVANGYGQRNGSETSPTDGIQNSNGSRNTHDGDGDIQMSNSDDIHSSERDNNTQNSSFGPSAQPRPPHSYTAPSQQVRQQSGLSALSQKSTVTPMAPNSQPADYANDASTTQTTSDKKHSGPSDAPQGNTQNSSGTPAKHDIPDLMLYPDRLSGDENLPDTQQGDSSWGSSQHGPLTGIMDYANSQPNSGPNGTQSQSQPRQSQPPVPPFDGPASRPSLPPQNHPLHDLLNADDVGHTPKLVIDDRVINELHQDLTDKTGGLSVEQLEQINSYLMDDMWKLRHRWNRTEVVQTLRGTFEDVLAELRPVDDGKHISVATL